MRRNRYSKKRIKKSLSATLRTVRGLRALTQGEVAARVGITLRYYESIEAGHSLPRLPVVGRLSVALGVAADVLLGLQPLGALKPFPAMDSRELRKLARMVRRVQPRQLRLIRRIADEFDRLSRNCSPPPHQTRKN